MTVYIVWQVAREVDGENLSPLIEYVTCVKELAEKYIQKHTYDRLVNIGGNQFLVVSRDIIEAEVDQGIKEYNDISV